MKRLNVPLKDVDQRKIYEECAGNFKDETALGYTDKVVSSSLNYDRFVPKSISEFPEEAVKEEDKPKIIKVYTEKFAKKEAVGHKYYEAIVANAGGNCPICGGGKVKNLDHFLPKTNYPLLCVTPANLIPTCRDCNFDKNDFADTDYYSIPFNPYFDVMREEWLECKLTFYHDHSFAVEFYNGLDKDTNERLWEKYNAHLTIYDLNATFMSRASEELNNCLEFYLKLYRECGAKSVEKTLIDCKMGCEKNDINSWKSALYRELVRLADAFCDWLAEEV